MKRFIIKEPQDVVSMVLRRKWWLLLTFLPLAFIATLVALLLPNIYVSETLILVEPKDVPDDVVKDFITAETQERLLSIQQAALSRTNLLRLLNDFPDDFSELRGMREADQIEMLRQRIDIELTTSSRGRDSVVPFFFISYQDRDPALAQKVTDRLATFFIDQDARTREQQVFGTAEFLQRELEKVGRQLEEEETLLAQMKERYRYELPEQLDTNLRTLDRLQENKKANAESHDRYLSLKLDLERRISETSPVITREEARRRTQGTSREESALVAEYRQKERQLAQLTSRYTDRHPDVLRLQTELEQLREEIPPGELVEVESDSGPDLEVVREPNPLYQQLNSQLAQVDTELRILEERARKIDEEIALYARRIESTPEREQLLSTHQRRFAALQERYQDLESKLTQAQLAGSLESRQKGEQFQVYDPASFPTAPAKPNRLLMLAAGFGIALGAGAALALAADFADQKIWNANEVKELLRVPVLGEIPEITLDEDLKKKKRQAWLRVAGYASLILVATAAIYLVYTTPALRSAGTEELARLLGW